MADLKHCDCDRCFILYVSFLSEFLIGYGKSYITFFETTRVCVCHTTNCHVALLLTVYSRQCTINSGSAKLLVNDMWILSEKFYSRLLSVIERCEYRVERFTILLWKILRLMRLSFGKLMTFPVIVVVLFLTEKQHSNTSYFKKIRKVRKHNGRNDEMNQSMFLLNEHSNARTHTHTHIITNGANHI